MHVFDISMLYDFLILLDIYIQNDFKIKFIPVQPGFATNQVYILVSNVRNFNGDFFDKIYCSMGRSYFPIVDILEKTKSVMTNKNNIDFDSFRKIYYIKLLTFGEKKQDTIISPFFRILKLNQLVKMSYNLEYLKYEDEANLTSKSIIYNKKNMPKTHNSYKKARKIRSEFIEKYDLKILDDGTLDTYYDYNFETYVKINKMAEKINLCFD